MTGELAEWLCPHHHIGRRVLVFQSLSSTNDRAAELAADPANDGVVVIARSQTAGRGRLGRPWSSPAGAGVWMSVVLRPPAAFRRPVVLTAWATVAVAEVVEALVGRRPVIKWPNDVLIDGQKFCGILVEQGKATVVGIGLNVNQTRGELDAAGLSTAGSLRETAGLVFDADDAARRLIQSLDQEYDLLLSGNSTALATRWAADVGLLGRAVEVELTIGETYRGMLASLTFTSVELARPERRVTFAPESVCRLQALSLDVGESLPEQRGPFRRGDFE